MQLLLIKISALDAKPEYALLGKKQAEDRFTPGEWSKVRSLSRGRKVLLLVPDNDVVLTAISVPSKNRKQLLQAVPFAMEDNLADDIDDLHFAIHQEDDSNNTQVALINRDLLDAYINLLKREGMTAHFILPQIFSQKTDDKVWSIQQHPPTEDHASTVSVRFNNLYGFSCDESLLGIFLEQYEGDNPESVLSNLAQTDLPESLHEIPLSNLDSGLVHYKSVVNALPLNLMTGFVSQKNNTSSINLKAWRAPIIIGSMVAAAWVGIFAWQNNLLNAQKNQLNTAIENTFKTSFPKSRVVDAPQQMATKLAQLKKSAGKTIDSPLPMISDIAPLLKEYKDMSLSEVRYQDNELVLVMQSPNLTRLETFKKDAITKAKLQVDIKSSTTTADKVKAILVISPLTLSQLDQEKG